jgi:hypothetical protein
METGKRNIKMDYYYYYYYYYCHLKHERLVIVYAYTFSRRRRKNRGSIFAYHYVLKDKNPVQICPIYMYITPTKHVFVTSVTGRTLIKCNPGMVFFQLDPCI